MICAKSIQNCKKKNYFCNEKYDEYRANGCKSSYSNLAEHISSWRKWKQMAKDIICHNSIDRHIDFNFLCDCEWNFHLQIRNGELWIFIVCILPIYTWNIHGMYSFDGLFHTWQNKEYFYKIVGNIRWMYVLIQTPKYHHYWFWNDWIVFFSFC